MHQEVAGLIQIIYQDKTWYITVRGKAFFADRNPVMSVCCSVVKQFRGFKKSLSVLLLFVSVPSFFRALLLSINSKSQFHSKY